MAVAAISDRGFGELLLLHLHGVWHWRLFRQIGEEGLAVSLRVECFQALRCLCGCRELSSVASDRRNIPVDVVHEIHRALLLEPCGDFGLLVEAHFLAFGAPGLLLQIVHELVHLLVDGLGELLQPALVVLRVS